MEIPKWYKRILESGTWAEVQVALQELSRIQIMFYCERREDHG